ncbi:MAG: hypothetical protein JW709_03565 [Sedimentisphaerales bacterium]|nr:hypothetical protein [Sedimentisphaerales bacterium]
MAITNSPSRRRGIGSIAHLFLSQSTANGGVRRQPPPQEGADSPTMEKPVTPHQSVVAAFHLTDPSPVLCWWREQAAGRQDVFRYIGSEQALGESISSPVILLCTSRDEDVIATYQLIKRLVRQHGLEQGPEVCICESDTKPATTVTGRTPGSAGNNQEKEVFNRLNNACERYLGVSCRRSNWPESNSPEKPFEMNNLAIEELRDLRHPVSSPDEEIISPPEQRNVVSPSHRVSLPPIHQAIPIETFPEDDIWLTRLLAEQAVLWLVELHGPVVMDVRLPDRLDERGRVLVDGRGRLWGLLASLNDDSQLLPPGLILRHWINEHAGLLADACRGVYVDAAQHAGLILATAGMDRTLEDIAAETHTGDILTRRIHFLTRGLSRALLVV